MTDRVKHAYVPPRLGNAAEGIIRFFASHRTAHNLLMLLVIILGFFAALQLRRQFFPDLDFPILNISIAYDGATALQVDRGIVEPLEPDLRQISDVTSVEATSRDGIARFEVSYPAGTDMDAALSEAERILNAASLPTDASDPVITQVEFSETVTRFVLSGPVRHDVLTAYANDLSDLIERDVDGTVTVFGGPALERRVELDPMALEAAGLSVEDVATTVARAAREVSAGSLEGSGLAIQAGTLPTTAQEIENIALSVLPDGSTLRVGDVGSVRVAADPDTSRLLYIGADPAVEVEVVRGVTGDTIEIRNQSNAIVEAFIEDLPANITITEWGNSADLVEGRINLLIKNGIGGLIIVLILLFLFMGARSAIWVAMGIPVAILGTFAVMLGIGETLNMISLFAILLSLGIIVDDAIVVAEHADALNTQGIPAQEAAMRGGIRMSGPVLASSLTTIAAFMPLFIVSGETGAFILAFPLVVIAVIIASLLECFLILPGHMKHALSAREREQARGLRPNLLQKMRTAIDGRVDWVRERAFGPAVRWAISYRYVVITLGGVFMFATVVLFLSGRVEMQFSPEVEFNNVFASFELAETASLDETVAFCGELNRSLEQAVAAIGGQDDLIIAACYTGVDFLARGPGDAPDAPSSTYASMAIELADADVRTFGNDELIAAWRDLIQAPANLQALELDQPTAGPASQSIRVRLQGSDLDQLALAADALVQRIEGVDGASDVSSSFALGSETLDLNVNDFGRAIGLSNETIGSQMRAALTGATAYRFIEDGEELDVRFTLASEDQGGDFQETFRVKTTTGSFANLSDVATATRSRSINRVRRVDGQIFVLVSGNLDDTATPLGDFRALMSSQEISDLLAPFGASVVVGGAAEQEAVFYNELKIGGVLGLIMMFLILAWVFSSYTRPLVVLLVIPFGIVGAIVGHWALAMPLSLLSAMSIFGLSGIVVNDAIVLVSRIDERAEDEGIYEAIIGAAKDRLRAIILTSVTTIGGLLPLMFETSVQAQFLIPMAVTVVFGLAFSTFLLLFFVPALVAFQADFGLGWRLMFFDRIWPDDDPRPASQE